MDLYQARLEAFYRFSVQYTGVLQVNEQRESWGKNKGAKAQVALPATDHVVSEKSMTRDSKCKGGRELDRCWHVLEHKVEYKMGMESGTPRIDEKGL